MSKEAYYTQSELLKMGFTKTMMKTLLSDPILKTNPHYRSGPPMKLFLLEEVEQVKNSDQFQEHMVQFEKRRKSALKAVETKKNKLMKTVDDKIACINVIKVDQVHKKALIAKEDWEIECGNSGLNFSKVSKETQERWVVNYIRHHLTDYDRVLYKAKGKVGIREAYRRYKFAVLDEIARVYPEYSEACERQKSNCFFKIPRKGL